LSKVEREASIALRNNRRVTIVFPSLALLACLRRQVASVHEIDDRHIMVFAIIH